MEGPDRVRGEEVSIQDYDKKVIIVSFKDHMEGSQWARG